MYNSLLEWDRELKGQPALAESWQAPVDKYTVKINLTQSDPALVGYVTWTRYSNIMPKSMYDKVNILTQGIGTGPYKLTEFVPDDHAVLTRNPDYWNKEAAYFDEISIKVLADDQARVAG